MTLDQFLHRIGEVFGPLAALFTFIAVFSSALGIYLSKKAALVFAAASSVLILGYIYYAALIHGDRPLDVGAIAEPVRQLTASAIGKFDDAPLTQFNGQSQSTKDCEVCSALVYVPRATAVVGAPSNEPGANPTEMPQHIVRLRHAFWIGRYEITVSEFSNFVNSTGYNTTPGCLIKNLATQAFYFNANANWRSPGFEQSQKDPVVCVSFEDANAYTRWLSKMTGKSYRLPSESEWETAARAGTRTPYQTGKILLSTAANVLRSISPIVGTKPVGTYAPNKLGLYDMEGNVWEWTLDCRTLNYDTAPTDGTPDYSGNCKRHVSRGGSWANPPSDARYAKRSGDRVSHNFFNVGFRIARDVAAGDPTP